MMYEALLRLCSPGGLKVEVFGQLQAWDERPM